MRKIAVFDLPFRGRCEFAPLAGDPSFEFARVKPFDLDRRFPDGADVLIIPGSGKTIADMEYLRQHGGFNAIRSHCARGGAVVGICGGYQSLGVELYDSFGRQGHLPHVLGIGLIPVATTFGARMARTRSRFRCLLDGEQASGEEFRSGTSFPCGHGLTAGQPLFSATERIPERPLPDPVVLPPGVRWEPGREPLDGWVSDDRRVWGTYLHLVFHNEAFRRLFFGSLA